MVGFTTSAQGEATGAPGGSDSDAAAAEKDLDEAQFSSTNVESAIYDKKKGELLVTFVRDGRQYLYSGVDKEAWEGWKNAPSAGAYFRANIMGLPYERA